MVKTAKRRRRCSELAHKQAATRPTVNCPKKVRSWSDDSMLVAIDAVKSGRKGINRALAYYSERQNRR